MLDNWRMPLNHRWSQDRQVLSERTLLLQRVENLEPIPAPSLIPAPQDKLPVNGTAVFDTVTGRRFILTFLKEFTSHFELDLNKILKKSKISDTTHAGITRSLQTDDSFRCQSLTSFLANLKDFLLFVATACL